MEPLTSQNPSHLLDELLYNLLSLVPADVAMWFAQGSLAGREVIRTVELRAADRSVLPVSGRDFVGGVGIGGTIFDRDAAVLNHRRGLWSANKPAAHQLNHFSLYSQDYTNPTFDQLTKNGRPVHAYERLYRPLDVVDQVRALVYQGARLLGWLGLFRCGDGPNFSPVERDVLNSYAPQFVAKLSSIEALNTRDEPDDIEHLIFDSTLGLQWCSPHARLWLTARRRRLIVDALRQRAGWFIVDSLLCLCHPMELSSHAREYLVTLEPIQALELHPLHGLADDVRAFARCVARGMSISETARFNRRSRTWAYKCRDSLFGRFGVESSYDLTLHLMRIL